MSANATSARDGTELGVREAAAAIAAGRLAPLELTRALLRRIEAVDGRLNAFRTVTAEQALADAERAGAAVQRGEAIGPLHGVPIAVKDNMAVHGVRMTAGTPFLADHVAAEDAEVVTRLRRAGAVLLGKLSMSEWAIGATGHNRRFGPCRNAWDPERIAGGSSSGAGAAVAAGLAPAALGSDTGGSVRIPAALNGIAGLRPTAGRVSNRGTIPVAWTFDVVGPIARRVEDVARLLEVIAGPDPGDPVSAMREGGGYEVALERGVDGLRVALLSGAFAEGVSGDVATALEQAAAALEGLGADVRPVELPGREVAAERMSEIMLAEAACQHGERLAAHPEGYADDLVTRVRRGLAVTGPQYARARQAQRAWTRAVLEALDGHDALLAPCVPFVAPRVDSSDPLETTARLTTHLTPFSLARLPALAVPCGFSAEGLPLSMQLVGRHFDEAVLLRVGHAYQQATDWHLRLPPDPTRDAKEH